MSTRSLILGSTLLLTMTFFVGCASPPDEFSYEWHQMEAERWQWAYCQDAKHPLCTSQARLVKRACKPQTGLPAPATPVCED